MDHQDWNTIYITKPKKTSTSTQKKPSTYNNEKQIENDIENGNMKTKKLAKHNQFLFNKKDYLKILHKKNSLINLIYLSKYLMISNQVKVVKIQKY